jgi:hypothetical protein
MGRRGHVMKEQMDLFQGGGPKSLIPGADVCASRHRGAETSVEAFRTTPESTRQRQRDDVLRHVRARGDLGATCEETSITLGIPYTAASARFTELQRLGQIEFGALRRPTTHGKSARVYTATAAQGGAHG